MFRIDDHPNATPVITLELLSRPESHDSKNRESEENSRPTLILDSTSGVHFLTEDQANSLFSPKLEPSHAEDEENDDAGLSPARAKQELLEYLIRSDGSVVCKMCGEILQSRTHWYRHKYKFHVMPSASPAPIFKCEQCGVFFKSRKGYIGHIASRHPENDTVTSEQGNTSHVIVETPVIKQEPIDPELAIPSCELPNANYSGAIMCNTSINNNGRLEKKTVKISKGTDTSEIGNSEYENQRLKEERLVADIIARVRRECEAAGVPGGTRRGYSRRSALTNG